MARPLWAGLVDSAAAFCASERLDRAELFLLAPPLPRLLLGSLFALVLRCLCELLVVLLGLWFRFGLCLLLPILLLNSRRGLLIR